MAEDGPVSYDRFDFDRQAIESEREAFFLRITGPGDYRYEGADLGILITRGRVMGEDFELNDRARNWIRGIKKLYAGKPLIEPRWRRRRRPVRSRSLAAGRSMEMMFEAIDEDRPGAKWRGVFDRHWHAYSRWFLREGVRERAT